MRRQCYSSSAHKREVFCKFANDSCDPQSQSELPDVPISLFILEDLTTNCMIFTPWKVISSAYCGNRTPTAKQKNCFFQIRQIAMTNNKMHAGTNSLQEIVRRSSSVLTCITAVLPVIVLQAWEEANVMLASLDWAAIDAIICGGHWDAGYERVLVPAKELKAFIAVLFLSSLMT